MQVAVPELAQTGAVMVNNVGAVNLGSHGSYNDAIYRGVTVNSRPPANTPIRFTDTGIEGLDNESWGIDNVRVVRVSDSAVVYSASFEGGAGPEWSDRTTDNTLPGTFSSSWVALAMAATP